MTRFQHLSRWIITMTILFIAFCMSSFPTFAWNAAENPIITEWGATLNPDKGVWAEYPRPTLQRQEWQNLNGLWDYAIVEKGDAQPSAWQGDILVPFCVESALSGVKKTVGPDKALWYRKTIAIPEAWRSGKVLLHFDAVDWEATVWINGKEVGIHRGGYDRFSFDITPHLHSDAAQEIVLRVWDPTDAGAQPRGKQVRDPKGIWYTAVTGIWQSVWMEPVPESYIQTVRVTPNIESSAVAVKVDTEPKGKSVKVEAIQGSNVVAHAEGDSSDPFTLQIENPLLWDTENPHLYDLKVTLLDNGVALDTVKSYFGMRDIKVAKDDAGINRLMLNGKPLFQYGPLDQGWWPDGLYTAPSDAALKSDIIATRNFRFNMIRKHVKVEPERWYYHCDRIGMLVWQDMPSGDTYIAPEAPDIHRSPESETQFFAEYESIIDQFWNHPSIIMWVPFNEGWGQFESAKVTDWTRKKDPTRLVNTASGWTDRGIGEVHDIHRYPGPAMPPLEENRAAVLGEFGGLGLPLEGHLWMDNRNWGYRTYATRNELQDNYDRLLIALHHLIGQGLAAAVYTQTTDVEREVNGLMTYDRKVIKFGEDWLAQRNEVLWEPAPGLKTLLPTSETEPQTWRYTFDRPHRDWVESDFDDSAWKEGKSVFGTDGTPGANIQTTWDTRDIWLRRTIQLDTVPQGRLLLRVHHDEDVDIHLNGVRAAVEKGYTNDYVLLPLDTDAVQSLKPGENIIAVHCRQTDGGQCIDVGLDLEE